MPSLIIGFILLVASIDASADFSSLAKKLSPGQWYEIPNTSVRTVLVSKEDAASKNLVRNRGSEAVIENWSGAAFDGKRIYFQGGGHKSYGGNEIYSFNLDTLRWERYTEPEPLPKGSTEIPCPRPTSTPPASHTYDSIVWTPKTRRIYRFTNGAFCQSGGYSKVAVKDAWEFNPEDKNWVRKRDWIGIVGSGNPKTAIDPISGNIIYDARHHTWEYDPEKDTYSRKSPRHHFSGEGSLAFNHDTREALLIDQRGFWKIPWDGPSIKAAEKIFFTGDKLRWSVHQAGLVYDTKRKVFVLWPGRREVYTLNTITGDILEYPNLTGSAPSLGYTKGIFSKFFYVEEHDVLIGYSNVEQGIWLYRIPDKPQLLEPAIPHVKAPVGAITVCSTNCDYQELQMAVNASQDGDTIFIQPESYYKGAFIDKPNLTIKGVKGTRFIHATVGGKATFVTQAPGIVIENIECSEVSVRDKNGACVRIEAPNLTLRNVYFHDNENGILGGSGGGTTLIENSLFERNGKGGRAHSIYIGKDVDTFILRNTKILDTKGEGHAVKSRAKKTIIEFNTIEGNLDNSREIDIPNGGEVVVKNNTIRKSLHSVNRDMFGIALEPTSGLHKINKTEIVDNTIFLNKSKGRIFTSKSPVPVIFERNDITGTADTGFSNILSDKNKFHEN